MEVEAKRRQREGEKDTILRGERGTGRPPREPCRCVHVVRDAGGGVSLGRGSYDVWLGCVLLVVFFFPRVTAKYR